MVAGQRPPVLGAGALARRRLDRRPGRLDGKVAGVIVRIAALAAALCTTPAHAADYAWPVARVVDGDTVEGNASADMPPELAKLMVRLRGVDTPEKGRRDKCPAGRAAGLKAAAFTRAAADRARAMVRDPAWGERGGRVVARLILDGRSLSGMLIATGYGRPYSGEGRKSLCK